MGLLDKYRFYCKEVYFWSLVLIAISLLFVRQLIVVGQILLILNWILEGDLKNKFKIIIERKSILVFLCIYCVLIIWLLNTRDFGFASFNIFMKLPLLIFPVVIGTSAPLSLEKLKKLLQIFITAVLISSLISTLILYGIIPYKYNDIREISIFISHIRFSLMIVLSILIMLYWIISEGINFKRHLAYVLACFWLFFFLILLKSLTGVIVLFVSIVLIISFSTKYISNQFLKIGLILILYSVPIYSAFYIVRAIKYYYSTEKVNFSRLDKYTVNGNQYFHDTLKTNKENGHFIYLYINQEELKEEWNKRSKINYEGLDYNNQPVESTLLRYLSSKGLRKDSVGIWKLSNKDIRNIEKGISNYLYAKKASLYPRIHEVIWEIDQYIKYRDPNGHSVTQRLIYSKMAVDIFKKHPLFGVGTGDVRKAVATYYITHNTGLTKKFQRDIHNQYLRFLVTFGIIGFLIIMAAFIIPPVIEKKWKSYYFLMIIIILFLSFLNEDTIETQIGVSFAAFFYSLFLWGTENHIRKLES